MGRMLSQFDLMKRESLFEVNDSVLRMINCFTISINVMSRVLCDL